MHKKLSLTLILFLFPLLLAGQQLKVGIMNPDRVMDALPETAQVQQELERYIEQRQQEFVSQYTVWMEAVNRYEEMIEDGTLSGREQEEEEERLIEREEELTNLERRIQMQIQNRQNELINPIMERVEQALETAAIEMDLEYVLNTQTSAGDPLVYFASERSVDITDRVIEILTSNQ